jgi:hypothetical protein
MGLRRVAVAITLLLGLAAQATAGAVLELASLTGLWVSQTCEAASPAAPLSTRRKFTFSHSKWRVDVTFYQGANCVTPVFGMGLEGIYTLEAAAPGAPASLRGTFSYVRKTAWALSAAGGERLTAARCGAEHWRPGMVQDVSATGCLAFPAISENCRQEYDIVQIKDETLTFGARNPDMCRPEGRPTALSPFALIRPSNR